MEPIIFYGDELLNHFNTKNIRNFYLRQNIPNFVNNIQHFTGEPQLDSSMFKYFRAPLEFKTFGEFRPGKQGLIIIGFHGGHSPLKFELLDAWFNSDPNRLAAFNDPNCRIVLDYCLEGFTVDFFPAIWDWVHKNNLDNRIIYISGATNVDMLYQLWCAKMKKAPNMLTAWYGFFTNWLTSEDTMVVQVDGQPAALSLNVPQAHWEEGAPRYMCLNRRPHHHRILTTVMLEEANLIDSGCVSLPKEFSESDVNWDPVHWDLKTQWEIVKGRENGWIDHLQPAFERLLTKLPLIADKEDFGTNYALDLNLDFYKKFPVNLVTETLYYDWGAFTSEKIWKPMVAGQIFVVMASPYYLDGLRELGFRTFDPYIDESYDHIVNPIERAIAVANAIGKICSLSNDEFKALLEKCRPIIEHNRSLVLGRESMIKIATTKVVRAIEYSWLY